MYRRFRVRVCCSMCVEDRTDNCAKDGAKIQCPEIVRKPSAYRTTSGRFPDIEVRKSSAHQTPSGRLPDLGRPERSPGWEIAGFVMHPGAEKKSGAGGIPARRRRMLDHRVCWHTNFFR